VPGFVSFAFSVVFVKWACLIPHETTMPFFTPTPADFRKELKALSKATIKYLYKNKLTSNGKRAELVQHDHYQAVFNHKRVDFSRSEKGTKRWDSLQRTRKAIYDIADTNLGLYSEPPVFATFTFADNVTDVSTANAEWRLFVRRLIRHIGKKPAYITVTEFQKRGAVHFHTLFFNLPFIQVIEFENLWGNGYTNLKALHEIRNVSAYLCKYLTKETSDARLYGRKVYFCSRGLLRPVVTRDTIEIENTLQEYCLINDKRLTRKTIYNYETKQ